VILGIRPDRPETGYGYIRADGARVAQLRRETRRRHGQRYLADGRYFWNAGIFVLRASVWLAALERFRPDIAGRPRARPGRHARRPTPPSCARAGPRSPPCRRNRWTTP
jgi:mannose-1-phosphate guanylyltransferase/mannose-6-phosphate isomerase